MLTINQIVRLYEEGVDIKFKKYSDCNNKGEFDPCTLEIYIYDNNLDSECDKDITILHEFVHAKYDVPFIRKDKTPEELIELEAVKTYNKKPYILEFIKWLYKI